MSSAPVSSASAATESPFVTTYWTLNTGDRPTDPPVRAVNSAWADFLEGIVGGRDEMDSWGADDGEEETFATSQLGEAESTTEEANTDETTVEEATAEETTAEDGEATAEETAADEATEEGTAAAAAPDAQYYDTEWSVLPRAIRLAYEALGYTEELWNAGESPPSSEMAWDDLSGDERFAAGMLGYNQASWDGAEGETAAEDGKTAPDAQYHDMEWAEIPRAMKLAYEALGYTEDYWCNGGDEPASSDMAWSELSGDQRFAAGMLGYNEASWDGAEEAAADGESEADPSSPAGDDETRTWDELDAEYADYLQTLGYDQETWDGGEKVPADYKEWDDLTFGERFWLTGLGFTKGEWDATPGGEHFALQPGSAVAEVAATGAPSPVVVDVGWTSAPAVGIAVETPADATEEDKAAQIAKYDESDWSDLPPEVQLAYEALGYSEAVWCGDGDEPASNDKDWSELSEDEQKAAGVIGYTKQSWDGEDASAAADAAADSASDGEKTAPDAEYHDEAWVDLPAPIKLAYEALGYTEDYWCNGGDAPAAGDKGWSELSADERAAATVLGYDQSSWDGDGSAATEDAAEAVDDPAAETASDEALGVASPSTTSATKEAPDAMYHDEEWGDLPPQIKAAYEALGYSRDVWCNGGDPPASEDKAWSELTAMEEAAASVLGYDEELWDSSEEELPAAAAAAPGDSTEVADVEAKPGVYDNYSFADLPPDVQEAAVTMVRPYPDRASPLQ